MKIADSRPISQMGTAGATALKARLEFQEDLVDLRSVLLIQVSLSRGLSRLRSRHSRGNIPREIPLGMRTKVKCSVSTGLLKILLEIKEFSKHMKKSR